MAILEELKPGVHLKGLLPGKLVTLIEVKPYGATVVEVTYKFLLIATHNQNRSTSNLHA